MRVFKKTQYDINPRKKQENEVIRMSNYTIHNILEYVNAICNIKSKLIKNCINKNEIPLFRGQADVDYKLLPYIGRDRESKFSITILNEERNLIDTAKYKMLDVFRNDLSPIELLALLQHHGIPTRLLDVTENALVALYFACCNEYEKDGEVFAFRHNEITTNYPLIEAIADSYRFAQDSFCLIDLFYERVSEQPYFLEQKGTLKAIFEINEETLNNTFGVHNLGEYIEKLCSNPLFIYAPIRSVRQQMQRGRYILFPNSIEDWEVKKDVKIKAFTTKINPIPKDHECIIGRYIVPSNAKETILQDLKLFGISEEILFCDNIDIVCKNIKHSFQDKVERDPFGK